MLNVMLVDNEANILKGLRCCLDWCALGCTIAATAQNGVEALRQLAEQPIDIVVTDVKMPGIDGLQLTKRLHEDYPKIQVIILTGFPDFEFAKRAISYGVTDFVLKPTNADNLRQAVVKAANCILKERGMQQVLSKLQSAEEQNLHYRQSMLLQKLIFGMESSLVFSLEQCAALALDLSGYFVVCFSVSAAFEEEDPDFDFTPYVERAENLLLQSFAPHAVRFVRKGSRFGYAIVLCGAPLGMGAFLSDALNISTALFDFSLSFGVSAFHTLPTELKLAAAEASYAQSFDRSSDGNGVMEYCSIPNMQSANLDRLTTSLRQLRTAVETSPPDEAQRIFREICRFITENGCSMAEAVRIHTMIYNSCLTALYERGLNGGDEGKRELLTIEAALKNDSYDRICGAISHFLAFVNGLIREASQEMDDIVRSVKGIIDQNYADDLTLESLSGVVHLSPGYLSKLFKRQLGQNLCTYIQMTRIEQAKRLLQTTSKKNYQIAEAVGIEDPVYFSRVFKRFTGMKPQEYRNQVKA